MSMSDFQRKLNENQPEVVDGLFGPRTHFAMEIFMAHDDADELRKIAKREFELRMELEAELAKLKGETE